MLKENKKNIGRHSKLFTFVIAGTLLVMILFSVSAFSDSNVIFTFFSNHYKAANPVFADDLFYQCVVDSYYNQNGIDSDDYEVNLSDEELATIVEVDCSNKAITKIEGIEKLTGLTKLNLSNNDLLKADLSSNVNLKELNLANNKLSSLDLKANSNLNVLNISDNPFKQDIYVYVKKSVAKVSSVILPESVSLSSLTWNITNNNIASLDSSSNIYGNEAGTTAFTASGDDYTVNGNIYVIDLASSKYIVNENFIYTGLDQDSETILNNIDLNYGTASIENNQLFIQADGKVIKTFDLVSVASDEYDLSKDYFYDNNKEPILDKITVTNGKAKLEPGQLLIVYDDFYIVKQYRIVTYASDTYDLSKDYIFVGDGEVNLDKIEVSNGLSKINENNLEITYGSTVLKNYPIVSYTSDTYDLSKDYILTAKDLDASKIEITNGEILLENNQLLVKHNDEVLKTFSVISYTSDVYDLSLGYILCGSDTLDISSIKVSNGVAVLQKDKILIKHEEKVVAEIPVIWYESSIYDLSKDYIFSGKEVPKESDIKVTNGSVLIQDDTALIKYKDAVLKTFPIVSYKSYTYDLTKDYAFSGNKELDISKIIVTNGDALVADNNLVIRRDTEVLKKIPIVWYNSDTYDLTLEYVFNNNKNPDLKDITVYNGNAFISGNKLQIKYHDDVLKEIPIVLYESSIYDVSNDYIFTKNTLLDLKDITIHNGSGAINDNHLEIKYEDDLLKKIPIIYYTSDTYDLSNNYIFCSDGSFDNSKINVVNGKLFVNQNEVLIKYEDTTLDKLSIVWYESSVYDLSKGYIFSDNKLPNKDDIKVTNGSIEIVDNTLKIKRNDEVLKSFPIIWYDLGTYQVKNGYIFSGTSMVKEDEIKVSNGDIKIVDDKIQIMYQDEVLKSIPVVWYESEMYNLSNYYIFVNDESLRLEKIAVHNGEAKLVNNDLQIVKEDEVLKTYPIVYYTSNNYDLSKNYVLATDGTIDLSDISVVNGTVELNDDKLLVKYGDNILKELPIVSYRSNVYDLNSEYIYVGSESINTNDIEINNGRVSTQDNHLLLMYEDEIIKSIPIVSYHSDVYDLSKDYIFNDNKDLDLNNITVSNGTISIEDGRVLIKHDDILLESINIVTYESSVYDLSKDYIFSGDKALDISKITVNNGETFVKDNILQIKVASTVIKSIPIVWVTSSRYDLSNEYIYTLDDMLELEDLVVFNGSATETDNTLQIKYEDKVVYEYHIVRCNSLEYDLSKDYIYTSKAFDQNNINSSGGSSSFDGKVFKITYNDKVVKSYDVLAITSDVYSIGDESISFDTSVSLDEFMSSFVLNGVSLEVYRDNEVVSDNVSRGDILKVVSDTYGVIKTYVIGTQYLEFGKLVIDDENKLIMTDALVSFASILNEIDTNGVVTLIDRKGNSLQGQESSAVHTGSSIKIAFGSETVMYKISVLGDINGDSRINVADVGALYQHVRKTRIINDECYLKASDVTGDGRILVNDVGKLYQFVRKVISKL